MEDSVTHKHVGYKDGCKWVIGQQEGEKILWWVSMRLAGISFCPFCGERLKDADG